LSSGRAALRIILKALNLPAGSEVMIPAYTDESVPWAIIQEGLKPIFCDVVREDSNIDTSEIECKINENTKAIVATHIFGNICNIEEILSICNRHDIILIEDCAHAPGVTLGCKKVGSFGRASYFSFSSTKHFNAYSGGCLCTNDNILAEKVKVFMSRCKSISLKSLVKEILFTWFIALLTVRVVFTFFVWPILFICSIFTKEDILINVYNKIIKKEHNKKLDIRRLSDLQAKIAFMKLELLDQENKKRVENVITLKHNLSQKVLDLCMNPREGSSYYFYIFIVKDKNILSRRLLFKGIDTGKFLMRNTAVLSQDKNSYPATEWLNAYSLQIPAYASLNKKDMLRIAKAINRCL
ncbi:aminotransferase class I/II-fold pyridoxal phosphate-dependent enzyme, partial [bacterium]|nr:aminotransferase class I/II-fold pyridoxal phosphate-dependent enzyme [bacterium]